VDGKVTAVVNWLREQANVASVVFEDPRTECDDDVGGCGLTVITTGPLKIDSAVISADREDVGSESRLVFEFTIG
jgi:hypothetical protein